MIQTTESDLSVAHRRIATLGSRVDSNNEAWKKLVDRLKTEVKELEKKLKRSRDHINACIEKKEDFETCIYPAMDSASFNSRYIMELKDVLEECLEIMVRGCVRNEVIDKIKNILEDGL